jgi:hypothetical protein
MPNDMTPASAELWNGGYARDLAQTFNAEAENHLYQGPLHPVLIFGTSQSGKSLALASLLNYMRQSSNSWINPRLMDFNYPKSCLNPDDLNRWARELYEGEVGIFKKNPQAKVVPTRKPDPFFVPVQATFLRNGIQSEGRAEVARFVFLEINGEWLDLGDDEYTFPPLRPEIAAILEHFNRPLSAIFVAPSAGDEVLDHDRVARSHQCLAHYMGEFSERRKASAHGDNLLLLATKWDAKYPPDAVADPTHFYAPPAQTVIEALGRFGFSWPAFKTMAKVSGDARAVMPYAATWIRNGKRTDEARFTPVFERFNRTIWDWLYGNAFNSVPQSDTDPLSPHPRTLGRKHLYPEFAQKTEKRDWYQVLMQRIVSFGTLTAR